MNWRQTSPSRADCPPYTITYAFCMDGTWHNCWLNYGAPGQKHLGATFDREEAKRICAEHAGKQRRAA